MPNIRRLSWRDRRVWTLTQTMTGEGTGSPPFQFPAVGEGEFLVRMTEAEWVEVFSALMTGADLSYPEKSHQVVWNLLRNLEFPVSIPAFAGSRDIYVYECAAQAGGAVTMTIDALQWHNFYGAQAAPAINDRIEVSTPIYLAAGDYACAYLYQFTPVSGIATLDMIDGSGNVAAITTVDQYNAATTRNRFLADGFQIVVPGNYRFRKRILSKHASSSGYDSRWTRFSFWGWF